ncbi:reverse transcriptase m [Pseudoscourfieldia marina]
MMLLAVVATNRRQSLPPRRVGTLPSLDARSNPARDWRRHVYAARDALLRGTPLATAAPSSSLKVPAESELARERRRRIVAATDVVLELDAPSLCRALGIARARLVADLPLAARMMMNHVICWSAGYIKRVVRRFRRLRRFAGSSPMDGMTVAAFLESVDSSARQGAKRKRDAPSEIPGFVRNDANGSRAAIKQLAGLRWVAAYLGVELPLDAPVLAGFILGYQCSRIAGGDITINQHGYQVRMLERYYLPQTHVETPALCSVHLEGTEHPCDDDVAIVQAVAGSLQYLRRPDIAFALRQVCWLMSKASPSVVQAAARVLQYVRDTGEYVNRFHEDEADGILRVYVDTSHGERTVSSMLSFFNGGVIDYDVARIKQCDSSSTGELGGLVKHLKRIECTRNFLSEIRHPQPGPTPVYLDSQALIQAITKDGPHGLMKHEAKWIVRARESVTRGIIEPPIPRHENLADPGTRHEDPRISSRCETRHSPSHQDALTTQEIAHREAYPHVREARANIASRRVAPAATQHRRQQRMPSS